MILYNCLNDFYIDILVIYFYFHLRKSQDSILHDGLGTYWGLMQLQ